MKKRLMTGLLAGGLMVVLTAPAALGAGATKQEGVIAPGAGTAKIVRTDNGVSVKIKLTGLTAGNVYSAWFFVGADGPPPPAHAAGAIANRGGKATLAGHLAEGGILSDARTDVIVVRVLDHGPKIPGSVRQQMTDPTFPCGGFCPLAAQITFATP